MTIDAVQSINWFANIKVSLVFIWHLTLNDILCIYFEDDWVLQLIQYSDQSSWFSTYFIICTCQIAVSSMAYHYLVLDNIYKIILILYKETIT